MFSMFIEAVNSEMVKVLLLVSMSFEDDHARFNIMGNFVPMVY